MLTLDSASGAFTGYPAGYEAALCIYDRLLDFDADMKIVPQLATSYEMSPDLMSMTLKLRAGVVFHDGTPCDAAAVKFNIERMMDKKRNTTNRPLWDPLTAVESPDPATIVLRTSAPFAALPNSLAHGSGAIVSPANIAKLGEAGVAQNPVGAGPYMLESFKPGQELVLKAFDNYWGGKQGADRLVFRSIPEAATRISALRTGAVDVIDAVPVQLVQSLAQDPGVQILRKAGLRPFGIAFNFVAESLPGRTGAPGAQSCGAGRDDRRAGFLRIRQGARFAARLRHRRPQDSRQGHFDQAKAKALLAEAGYQPGGRVAKDGSRSDAHRLRRAFPGDIAVSEIVVASLKQVGVEVTDPEDRARRLFRRAPAGPVEGDVGPGIVRLQSVERLGPLPPGVAVQVEHRRRRASRRLEHGSLSQREGRRALREANTNPDEAKRFEALGEAQRLVWEDAPYLWLQVNENVSAMRKGVTGVELWPIVFTSLRNAKPA